MKRTDTWFRGSHALRACLLVPWLALAVACGGHTTGDGGGNGDGSNGDGNGGDGATNMDVIGIDSSGMDVFQNDGPVVMSDAGVTVHDPDGGAWTCYPTTCRMHSLECGDCTDNDGDGLIDSHDPDCLGPCGNSEGPTLYPNVGGGTAASCTINCYFDYGIGRGSDGCVWSHHCDPHEQPAPNDYPQAGCGYDPASVGGTTCPATQSQMCLDSCTPLTPNGCDCFGCCTFPEIAGRGEAQGGAWVYLGSRDTSGNPSCGFDSVTDTARCHPCQPVQGCLNNCDPCEVCIGRPAPDPTRCNPTPSDAGTPPPDAAPTDGGSTGMQCPTGIQPCGLPGQAACAFGYYCITGCCQMAPG